jgi:glycosyltransferase 2 family protein
MKRKTFLLLKIALSVILLGYILIKVPVDKIFNVIQAADISLILISILLIVPSIVLSAFQTRYLILAQNVCLSLIDVIKIHVTTSFYSVFLPGSITAGVIKWYKFSKYGTKSVSAAIVILNRFMEAMVAVILGVLYSIPTLLDNHQRSILIIFVLILCVLLTGYSILFYSNFLSKLKKLIVKPSFDNFFSKKINSLLNAFEHFQNLHLKDHLEMFGIMISYHLINLISFYLLARSLDIEISIWVLGWIGTVVTILSIFPITISGFGIREGTLMYLLGYYAVAPQAAVALSFLAFFRTLIIALVGGLFELKDFVFKANIQKNVR